MQRTSEHDAQTLLIVEDDPALARLIQHRLGKERYSADIANSGAAAREWLHERSPRLVLLDYNLSDMLAEDLLDELEQRNARVPFVVMTGHGNETVAVEMMKRGALDYLVKTESFLGLLPTVIRQALDRLRRERRLALTEAKLRRAHDELERRVALRTAELAKANSKLRVEMEQRRQADQRVRQHQHELAHVARLSTMGEMLAEMAHELNQPLAAIASHSQACTRLVRGTEMNQSELLLSSLDQVNEQATRAAEIIRRLRRFVAKSKPAETLLDLNQVVRDIAALVDVDARSDRVNLRFELAESMPPVSGNRIHIEQVLVNLIRNALEAMRDVPPVRRELTIRTSVNGARIEVAIIDNGVGIPPEATDRIFDRFYTTKPNGMGMGLAISRSIVEDHGGQLWTAANPDRGITFIASLPIHHAESGRQ